MTGQSWLVDVFFWLFAVTAVISAYLVFRVDSMVRAAFWLLASFLAVGAVLVLLEARFLGLVLLLMMAGEMTIMAVFMVMFMMDPGGLGQMEMTHQKRTSQFAGVIGAFAALGVALLAGWGNPAATAPGAQAQLRGLGLDLMERSMLIFETAGVTILTAMVAATAVAVATRRTPTGAANGEAGGTGEREGDGR